MSIIIEPSVSKLDINPAGFFENVELSVWMFDATRISERIPPVFPIGKIETNNNERNVKDKI